MAPIVQQYAVRPLADGERSEVFAALLVDDLGDLVLASGNQHAERSVAREARRRLAPGQCTVARRLARGNVDDRDFGGVFEIDEDAAAFVRGGGLRLAAQGDGARARPIGDVVNGRVLALGVENDDEARLGLDHHGVGRNAGGDGRLHLPGDAVEQNGVIRTSVGADDQRRIRNRQNAMHARAVDHLVRHFARSQIHRHHAVVARDIEAMGPCVDRRQVPAAVGTGDALNDRKGVRRRLRGGGKRRSGRDEYDDGFEE